MYVPCTPILTAGHKHSFSEELLDLNPSWIRQLWDEALEGHSLPVILSAEGLNTSGPRTHI